MPEWYNTVMKWNFLKYLAAPAHLLMHMVHVPLYVYPHLASKYGYGQRSAYSLGRIGTMLGGSFRATGQSFVSGGRILRAAWQKDIARQLEWDKGTDALSMVTADIKNPIERKLFEILAADNHIHPNTGMDIVARPRYRDGPDQSRHAADHRLHRIRSTGLLLRWLHSVPRWLRLVAMLNVQRLPPSRHWSLLKGR